MPLLPPVNEQAGGVVTSRRVVWIAAELLAKATDKRLLSHRLGLPGRNENDPVEILALARAHLPNGFGIPPSIVAENLGLQAVKVNLRRDGLGILKTFDYYHYPVDGVDKHVRC